MMFLTPQDWTCHCVQQIDTQEPSRLRCDPRDLKYLEVSNESHHLLETTAVQKKLDHFYYTAVSMILAKPSLLRLCLAPTLQSVPC